MLWMMECAWMRSQQGLTHFPANFHPSETPLCREGSALDAFSDRRMDQEVQAETPLDLQRALKLLLRLLSVQERREREGLSLGRSLMLRHLCWGLQQIPQKVWGPHIPQSPKAACREPEHCPVC